MNRYNGGERALVEKEWVAMSTIVVQTQKGPSCLVQVLWFLFVGWWAGQIWIVLAWLAMLTILGIPLSVKMLNKLPQVIALRGQEEALTATQVGDTTIVTTGAEQPQRNILLRALYFVLIGWWLSALWMEAAYLACVTIIGMPLGFWMFDKVPALVSLRR
jgi:uncharacterized membrane protein YccF (DUF307 family)